ncbi:YhgE/Pip domain-containing protein [Bifidobacterium sp. B4081]|uniref:YhgE/Pip domain-containing protein n=1 Tax=unclassified Bifidobacterium TaxID=2608897 RepID=UPI0022697FAA|nr:MULTISPECIES: YhgE/Pip domain-containing protein [unclassified Bifidobacterium]MCX8644768.1 YhgE/Pip domain-containing protein [Bifidobacterium sp. B4077]MCX8646582.1 YhgE/Pip domain-containing protein [Bifidobacterium sp. B4081]MCX8668287.1 YhgE/Pip domain-containing protein [Bifidobacterium sp. B3998]
MKTVLAIFRRDLWRILRNPVALVVTIGVAVLPSLYAWFNIMALWDPYSNVNNLPVAVVSMDRGAQSAETGRINAGRSVIQELRGNKSLGWKFMDDDERAIEEVHSGQCYAAIIIPERFSADLVGIVEGAGNRPALNYYVNEKKNAIAPKVTDTGASTIDQEINAVFVSAVSDALAGKVLQTVGDAQGAAEQSRSQVVGDLGEIIDQLDRTDGQLDRIGSTMGQARQTVAGSRSDIKDLQSQISATQATLNRAQSSMAKTRDDSLRFSSALNQALADGSVRLSSAVTDVNTVAGGITADLNATQDKVDRVNSGLGQLVDANGEAVDRLQSGLDQSGLHSGDPAYESIQRQIDDLKKTNQKQKSSLDAFKKNSSTALDSGRRAASDLSSAMTDTGGTGIKALAAASQSLAGTTMPNLLTGLDALNASNGSLQGALSNLATTAVQTDALLDQLDSTIGQAQSTLSTTRASLASVRSDLKGVRTDVAALGSSAAWNRMTQTLGLSPESFGKAMASPVELASHTVYPVSNYGSSVAPFYTNLALWVGGFILIAIYKLEVDKEGIRKCTATQAYLGRWLLLVFVGFFQALIATVGDLMLGIQCRQPALFVLAGVFASFVYINIIYALAASFRHIGKALAVVLVILQIPGSSGMYPIEMMPDFFRNLNPWLPFTYGINAMRETIGGMYGNHYWQDMLHIFWYLPVALLIGLVVRRYLLNLNALFDRRLGATDLMLTEQNHSADRRLSLGSLARSILGEGDYRAVIRRRAHRFLALYPTLIRGGLVLVLLPVLFLILLFSTEAKIVMLIACIASIVLIDAYLIIVEYICDSYVRQLGLTERPGMDFLTLIRPRRQGPSAMTRLTTAVRESVMSRDEEDAPEDGDRR